MKYIGLFFIFGLVNYSCISPSPEELFDKSHPQNAVLTYAKIDSILEHFEQISFAELDDNYKLYTGSNGPFKAELAKKSFYILKGTDVLQYIVGEYRIKNFLATDLYYSRNQEKYALNRRQYWLVDKKLLYFTLDLILALKEKEYNPYGFKIRESHRYPNLNKIRGGASKSQHIWGKAVDIVIEDINKDGIANQADKTIVLEIMEKVVANKGGIGKYPNTMTVHYDTRGYKARWNSF